MSRALASTGSTVAMVHVGGGEERDGSDLAELSFVEIADFGEGPIEDGNSAICDSSHDKVINK